MKSPKHLTIAAKVHSFDEKSECPKSGELWESSTEPGIRIYEKLKQYAINATTIGRLAFFVFSRMFSDQFLGLFSLLDLVDGDTT